MSRHSQRLPLSAPHASNSIPSRRLSGAQCLLSGLAVALVAVFSLGGPVHADAVVADSTSGEQDLTAFRLEDLVNVEVTSASKREQRLPEIAAAITVIGRDQIRASGA